MKSKVPKPHKKHILSREEYKEISKELKSIRDRLDYLVAKRKQVLAMKKHLLINDQLIHSIKRIWQK